MAAATIPPVVDSIFAPPSISGHKAFLKGWGWGVYIVKLPAAGILCPPPPIF